MSLCPLLAAQVDVLPLKGMTLPASSFVAHPKMATQQGIAARYTAGEEEAFLLTMDGPFEQKTGGKGANAAAAAAQTFACELCGNLGQASAAENAALTRDLAAYGAVGMRHLARALTLTLTLTLVLPLPPVPPLTRWARVT